MPRTRNTASGRRTNTNDNISAQEAPVVAITPRGNPIPVEYFWIVDLRADPPLTLGATPIIRRCMNAYGWTEQYARRVLKAYRQFLHIKQVKEDWDATMLSPSADVDQMWHQHILDIVNYVHDCMLLCGHVVGHNPDGGDDVEARRIRREATRLALAEAYPGTYSGESTWNEVFLDTYFDENDCNEEFRFRTGPSRTITISVRDQDGNTTYFKIRDTMRMAKLFETYAEPRGVQVSSLRFLLEQEKINAESTPRMLELRDGDQIDCLREQSGC